MTERSEEAENLLSDLVVGGAAPAVVGVLAAVMIGALWFVVPLVRRDEE